MKRAGSYGPVAARAVRVSACLVLVGTCAAAGVRFAHAQPAPARVATNARSPGAARARTGFEAVLHGAREGLEGRPMPFFGIAYEVLGFAELRPLPRARIRARTVENRAEGEHAYGPWVEQTADARGRFTVSVTPAREDDSVEVELSDANDSAHEPLVLTQNVEVGAPRTLSIRTDRGRYEPDEPVRVWVMVRDVVSGAPVPGERVRVSASGREPRVHEVTTGPGGSALASIPVRASDGGALYLEAVSRDGRATSAVAVGTRVQQSMQVTARFDRVWARPGETARARIEVRDPSGVALPGVTLRVHGEGREATQEFTSGPDGALEFPWQTSTLARGGASDRVSVRASHPAYGMVETSASIAVTRGRYELDVRAAHGLLVPEVDDAVFLQLSQRDGSAAPAGVTLRVEHVALPGGAVSVTTDAAGAAEVRLRLRDGDAARHGDEERSRVTTLRVRAGDDPTEAWTMTVPVGRGARVALRAERPVVTAGEPVTVQVLRAASARRAPVWIELMTRGSAQWSGDAERWRVVSVLDVPAEQARVTVPVPAELRGMVSLRVREHQESEGSSDRTSWEPVLIAPRGIFRGTVRAESERYTPRATAGLLLHASQRTAGTYAALVLRDVSADAGEAPFERGWAAGVDPDWLGGDAREEPSTEVSLRGALVAGFEENPMVARELEAGPRVEPEVDPLDDDIETPDFSDRDEPLGVINNAWERRLEMLRDGLTAPERALMEAVQAGTEGVLRRRNGRVEFAPNAVAVVNDAGSINGGAVDTLGHTPMTVAMIEAQDPGFRVDAVLRLAARRQWVRLLSRLSSFVEPEEGTSPVAGDEPERWLSRMLERGAIPASALRDPWGGAFALRRTRDPEALRWSFSSRAAGYALMSPGPDGVWDTADDFRDPFARVVQAGTVFARVSGENKLLAALSRMGPGAAALRGALAAYARVADAEREEEVGDAAEAVDNEDAIGIGGFGTVGHGSGSGGGSGYGSGAGMGSRVTRAPSIRAAAPEFGSFARGAAMLRERFPATLFVAGEVPLDAQGDARVEVPLADALTTFRAYAIFWNSEGYITSARGEVHVDQDVVVDASLPTRLTEGDLARVPVRVLNHGRTAVDVTVRARGEDALAGLDGTTSLHVEPGGVGRWVVSVRAATGLTEANREGALRVTVARAGDGGELDAVRRRLRVEPEGRPVHRSSDAPVDTDGTWTLETPADATGGGRAEVSVRVGARAFGEGRDVGALGDELSWAAWSAMMVGDREGLQELRERVRAWVTQVTGQGNTPEERLARWRAQPALMARMMVAIYELGAAPDRRGTETALARLSNAVLGAGGNVHDPGADVRTAVLLALAPITRNTVSGVDHDAAVTLIDELARLVAREVPSEDPESLLERAVALTVSQRDRAHARLERPRELLRRALRSMRRSGNVAWIEPRRGTDAGQRARVTALGALAAIALDDRDTALSLLRGVVRERQGLDAPGVRSLLRVALSGFGPPASAMWMGGPDVGVTYAAVDQASGEARVWVDGVERTAQLVQGVGRVDAPELLRPGVHTMRAQCGECGILVGRAEVDHYRAWAPAPRAQQLRAQVTLEVPTPRAGERARAELAVHFQGLRPAGQPVAQITLPAGAELDPDALAAITRATRGAPRVDGRVLTLRLRALRPGTTQRVPLPFRWGVAGTLHGFGVALYDQERDGAQLAVLDARTIEVGEPETDAGPRASNPAPSAPSEGARPVSLTPSGFPWIAPAERVHTVPRGAHEAAREG